MTELYLAQVSLMSPVVLQLFPTPPAHVAGSSTPLVNNIIFSTEGLNLNHPFELLKRMKVPFTEGEENIPPRIEERFAHCIISAYGHEQISLSR